jgi:hypothetical protein
LSLLSGNFFPFDRPSEHDPDGACSVDINIQEHTMQVKQPQQLSFSAFCEHATIHKLKRHGRTASVFFGDKDLGFVDAMGERGLRQAHAREVNNALYLHSEFVSSDMPRPALPTPEALLDYPDLVAKFPIAASVLGFFVERNSRGTLSARYCFPNEEEQQTLQYITNAYGYLVERNERISLIELANRITDRYDVTEPRNRVVIETLRSSAGLSKHLSH